MNRNTSIKNLALPFLQIGLFSFGGFLSMIAYSKELLIKKYQLISEEDFDNGITYVLLLPGPTALNFCGYVGLLYRGVPGLIVAVILTSLPSLLMLAVIVYLYDLSIELSFIEDYFDWIPYGITCLMITVALNMLSKNKVKFASGYILVLLLIFFLVPFKVAIYLFLIASILLFNFIQNTSKKNTATIATKSFKKYGIIMMLGIGFLYVLYYSNFSILLNQFILISSYSMGMFGGGYIFIPLMEELLVSKNEWISNYQFYDGLAFAQITPGPIMISMYFFGFLHDGIITGLVFFLAILTLPLIIVALTAKSFLRVTKIGRFSKSIMIIKLVVIALLIASSFEILQNALANSETSYVLNIFIFILLTILHYKKIISPSIVIILSLLVGIVL